MKRLWVWDNGDYCFLEYGLIPADKNGHFVTDESEKEKVLGGDRDETISNSK